MRLTVDLKHHYPAFRLVAAFATEGDGVTALFGPSGSGKTSILRAVAGLLHPDQGHIAINDNVLVDTTAGVFLPPHKRRLGYVFQDARLFPHLTVHANLVYGARRSKGAVTAAEVDHLTALLGLQPLLDRKPAGLSGGEQQRVAIGRALLAQPQLLLLDEPLASIDAARRSEILPYLERLRDDLHVPMLYVSHAVDEVARMADRVVLLDAGEVIEHDSAENVLARFDAAPGDPGTVIRARVQEHDEAFDITYLGIASGTIAVPTLAAPVGAEVRLRIRGRDVLLATQAPQGLSANTVLPARVEAVGSPTGAFLDVRLQTNGARLIARITAKSAERLSLGVGSEVFAIIKTATLLR